MKKTYLIFSLAVILMLSMLSTSQAVVVFQNLGTGAPPFLMGGYVLTPFDAAPQAAIADLTLVSTIPGSPIFGNLTTSRSVYKYTVPATWNNWSHGYTGPVYLTYDGATYQTVVLYLPPFTGAFYFYAEGDAFATRNITATSNSGITSGPIAVTTPNGARGFGFYTTEDDEYISSITVTIDAAASGMLLGEFGIAQAPFMCVGQVCYYNCFAGSCPASHCDVYIPGAPQVGRVIGQITYHWPGCAPGGCPPSACSVYVPLSPGL
jgi:hypothetical protein